MKRGWCFTRVRKRVSDRRKVKIGGDNRKKRGFWVVTNSHGISVTRIHVLLPGDIRRLRNPVMHCAFIRDRSTRHPLSILRILSLFYPSVHQLFPDSPASLPFAGLSLSRQIATITYTCQYITHPVGLFFRNPSAEQSAPPRVVRLPAMFATDTTPTSFFLLLFVLCNTVLPFSLSDVLLVLFLFLSTMYDGEGGGGSSWTYRRFLELSS